MPPLEKACSSVFKLVHSHFLKHGKVDRKENIALVACSPCGREESDTTAGLRFHFSLSCIREGNGNPLQCSHLEIPGTGEPGGLPSMGSHRVGHDWSDLAAAAAVFLEKAMATHSSTPVWKIPWTEEPGGLQSIGSLRVGHNWATSLSLIKYLGSHL